MSKPSKLHIFKIMIMISYVFIELHFKLVLGQHQLDEIIMS